MIISEILKRQRELDKKEKDFLRRITDDVIWGNNVIIEECERILKERDDELTADDRDHFIQYVVNAQKINEQILKDEELRHKKENHNHWPGWIMAGGIAVGVGVMAFIRMRH